MTQRTRARRGLLWHGGHLCVGDCNRGRPCSQSAGILAHIMRLPWSAIRCVARDEGRDIDRVASRPSVTFDDPVLTGRIHAAAAVPGYGLAPFEPIHARSRVPEGPEPKQHVKASVHDINISVGEGQFQVHAREHAPEAADQGRHRADTKVDRRAHAQAAARRGDEVLRRQRLLTRFQVTTKSGRLRCYLPNGKAGWRAAWLLPSELPAEADINWRHLQLSMAPHQALTHASARALSTEQAVGTAAASVPEIDLGRVQGRTARMNSSAPSARALNPPTLRA